MSINSVEIGLWLEQRQYNALQRVLEDTGTTVETVMQARLEEFYNQTVPGPERQRINLEIEAERLAEERQRENNMRVSAFHVTENGRDSFFLTERPVEFLTMANRLRGYLRGDTAASVEQFADCFPVSRWLAGNQFQDLAEERVSNPRKIVGVFRVDFDSKIVSSLDSFRSWQNYKMEDVSAAAYHAFRKEWQSEERRWDIFLEQLEGKEVGQTMQSGPTIQTL